MRWIAALLLLGMGLAQTLKVAPQGQVGKELTIQGSDFGPGRYVLEIEAPSGSQSLELEATSGGFSHTYTPPTTGVYRFKVGQTVVQSQIAPVPAAPPRNPSPTSPARTRLPSAVLTADGLGVGTWKLPLVGDWIGPKTLGSRSFIAQGPLVLEIDLSKPAVVAQHYPPSEVRGIETDPEPAVLLEDGRRLLLTALAGRPYEGQWESLKVIQDYQQHLKQSAAEALDNSPAQGRPYWYYFVQDPKTLSHQDLAYIGNDLLERTHRPELPWGAGVLRWLAPWLEQTKLSRAQGLENSYIWSEFFLKYLPQLPGAQTLLADQASWLEAQGRPDLGQRYRDALRQVASWQNPLSSVEWAKGAWVFLGLYLLLLAYLALSYLPSQLRNLKPAGGWLMGWIRHPLMRLRHSVLAYTSAGERLALMVVFLALAGLLLMWGFAKRAENLVAQESLSRGTLRSSQAQSTLQNFANSSAMRGLLGYALARENPTEAQRLLETAPQWAYVLLNRGTPDSLAQAFKQAPASAAVREALGLGGDLWTPVYREAGVAREGVPTPRLINSTVALSGLQALPSDFVSVWLELPIWPNNLWAWGIAIGVLVLSLYHLMCFFLPRPKGLSEDLGWRRGVQLFFPGSPTYSQGWGFAILLLFVLGLWAWRSGNPLGWVWSLVALLAHLGVWWASRRRPLEA